MFSEESEFATEYLKMPDTPEQIEHVTNCFEENGLPGAGGSVDCVHWAWDNCPAGIRADCKGKEGHTTVVFEVIGSHTKRILAVSGPYFGTWNDKTIARLDENFRAFMPGGPYADIEWYWVDADGEENKETGLHMICDGGYHRWKILICPYKDQLEGADETIWSGLVESMRKDIECIFGILKKRFLVLKHATRLHNFETLGHVFRSCCILHNMLLEHDGWDDWRHLDNLLEEEDIEVEEMNLRNGSNQSFTRSVANTNNELNLVDADVNRLNDTDVREALQRVGPVEAVVTNDEALHDFDPDDFHNRT